MRGWFAALGALLLACASSAPPPELPAPAPATVPRRPPAKVSFPPTGPVELHPDGGPAEGALYQMTVMFDGRTEVEEEGNAAHLDPQSVDEKTLLEIDYRKTPTDAPEKNQLGFALVLEALMRRSRIAPPGSEQLIEIGDDRLRVSKDNKVSVDLRGAQPKEDLTPRLILGKAFALVLDDTDGNPQVVNVRGIPAAKKLLGTLPLRETIGYLQIPYPDHAVSAGDVWHGKRYLPNPIGKLGLPMDIEVRLIGFERSGQVPCAHVVLRSRADAKDVPSDIGFTFSTAEYEVAGDAWLDLATGEVVEARISDVGEISYHRTASASPARVRMRYEGRSGLKRLDALPPSEHWSDGTKRFTAVK